MAKSQEQQSNLAVDYVVVFHFDPNDKLKAQEQFETLLKRLASVGLATEVRRGNDDSILIFTKVASEEHLRAAVYRGRVKDWIHGIRSKEPAKPNVQEAEDDSLQDSERLEIIYELLTNPESEGGAGLTPGKGEWTNIKSLFALHDHSYNKEWIKKWSTRWTLTLEDLDDIRNRFGSKIAYYFAFTQSYFVFLLLPAAFGVAAWSFLGHFSPIYALVISLWSVVFTEWWQHSERDLALRWGVRGVSNIETRRKEFKPEKMVTDDITGETLPVFSPWSRLQRQALQAPFAILAILILGSLITTCFAIEVFISEVYSGPFKSYLSFLPTVILTTCMPFLNGFLTTLAKKLTDLENYETESQYENALTSKVFILNFIASYLSICLTAFVYVPFGAVVVPYLNLFQAFSNSGANKHKSMSRFNINPARLRKQFTYFSVTAQIVNALTEVVVPYLQRQGVVKFKEIKEKRAERAGGVAPSAASEDSAEEKEFLARVRKEAELPVYDVYDDLREMVVQFGYLVMFSVIWPLAPVSFAINNWVELRSDAIKIAVEMQRPTPQRADTIGPWVDALGFLGWLGSITMAALTYLFSNDGLGPDGKPSDIKGWALLLTMFFSEHLFLLTKRLVAIAISHIDSPGRQKSRRERYLTRRKYFDESVSHMKGLTGEGEKTENITRASLEEEARQGSLRVNGPVEKFWSHQRGWRDSLQVGQGFIQRTQPKESAKDKKEL